jgi:hypothetical protein
MIPTRCLRAGRRAEASATMGSRRGATTKWPSLPRLFENGRGLSNDCILNGLCRNRRLFGPPSPETTKVDTRALRSPRFLCTSTETTRVVLHEHMPGARG